MLLSPEQINKKLLAYRGWEYEAGVIRKTYRFSGFLKAIEVVNKIAVVAESLGHHPDMLIHHSAVTCSLTTHDEGGVTENDIRLMAEIEKLVVVNI